MFGSHVNVALAGLVLAIILYTYRFYLKWTIVRKQPAKRVWVGLGQHIKDDAVSFGFYFFMSWWAVTVVLLLAHEMTLVR